MSPARPRRALCPSTAESLESRLAPAIFSVNSLADVLAPPAGTVTLRSALQAANTTPGPNTINLTVAGIYRLTTLGVATDNSAGELAITGTSDLTIQNTSGGAATIQGGGTTRVLDIDPAAATKSFSVTLRGLTIQGGVGEDGGGIRVQGGAGLTLDHATITGNVAYGTGGGVAMEAKSTGTLTLLSSQITSNDAMVAGGGIADASTGLLALGPQSTVSNNLAHDGGGVILYGTPLSATGATFSGNQALVNVGGAIANDGAGVVTLFGCLVQGNSAGAAGGGYGDTLGQGILAVTNSFFLSNVAGGAGGAIYTQGQATGLVGTSVSSNYSPDGAGIVLHSTSGAPARFVDDVISGNVSGRGAGIESDGVALTISGSTLADDRAILVGGGLYLVSGQATITASLFRDDTANNAGGGIEMAGDSLTISGSRLTGNVAGNGGAIQQAGNSLTIIGTTLDNNRATINGGAIDATYGKGLPANLTDCTIASNAAGGDGGGVDVEPTTQTDVDLTDDTIDGNSAGGVGGGVALSDGSSTAQGTIIAGNFAAGSAEDVGKAAGYSFIDGGGNLLSTSAGAGVISPGILIADPKLGPLLGHGGPLSGDPSEAQSVPTQALLPGSPAIGKGVVPFPSTTVIDERGFPRPAKPSIGAYEPQYATNATPNQVFVENLYETLLNRPADSAGLAAATSFLNGGGSPTALIQVFQSMTEYLDGEVTQLYHRYLDRAPSASETTTVAGLLKSGVTPEQLAAVLLGSDEFFRDFGGNNDTFIEAAFRASLGRTTATQAEFNAWDQALAGGTSRTAVGTLLLTTTEYLTDLITADFDAYDGRDPSAADLTAFLRAAHNGVSSPTLAAVALTSSYAART